MPKERKKPGHRNIKSRLFILCEGMKDKSESAYFKELIKHYRFDAKKVAVKVKDTVKNTGRELVVEAKKLKEFPIDEVWVVYDMDGYTKHPSTFSMARDSDINIAFSAISFEHWILLHFEETTKAFLKSKDIISYMKKKEYILYTKNAVNTYSQIKHLQGNAIKNAKKTRALQISGNPEGTQWFEMNPFTNVDVLVERIISLSID